MSIPPFLKTLLGGGDGKVLQVVKDTADEFIYSKEEKAEDQLKLQLQLEESEHRKATLEQEALNKSMEDYQKLASLDATDKASARRREVDIAKVNPEKVSWLAVNTPTLLGWAAVVFVMAIFFFVFYTNKGFSQIQRDLLFLIIGHALGNYHKTYEFFLGSSFSSKSKDATIENLTKDGK